MDQPLEKRERLLSGDPYVPGTSDRFVFGGRRFAVAEITEILRPFLTDDRAARIEDVVVGRTRSVVPVVEGLVNMGNVSAVMRSAEALGYQSFHVVTDGQAFKNSKRTSQGAEKWLDVYPWSTPADCVEHLKQQGYRILATHLGGTSRPIAEQNFTDRTAIVFGNERDGVSKEMLERTDENIVLPIEGFVQSYNISVAAALALYHAYRDRIARQGFHGDLTRTEIEELRAVYYLRSVRRAEQILAEAAAAAPSS